MDKPNWDKRQKEYIRLISDIGRFAKSDPARQHAIQDARKKMQDLLDNEELHGQPEWVILHRERERKRKELSKKAPPILTMIRERIEEATGQTWGKDLHIGCNLDLDFVGFDVWYERDAEMEQDRASGRQSELIAAMTAAAREIANARSEVRFHSHQFVKEKCGGNYFNYLR